MKEKTQFHAAVIREVVVWVEKNINERTSIEMVSEFSGYSKWYIQKLFKQHCGYSLGEYIRLRKLNKSTALLHLTRIPVYQIADLLGFDSHQTFHKNFVRFFGITPALYRKEGDWPAKKRIPYLCKKFIQSNKPLLVTHEEQIFRGKAVTISTDLESSDSDFNRILLYDALGVHDFSCERILLISSKHADLNRVLSVEIILVENNSGYNLGSDTIQRTVPSGLFLELKATLVLNLIDSWVQFNYSYTLPEMGLSRRKGVDIEYIKQDTAPFDKETQVKIRYLIPVKFSA